MKLDDFDRKTKELAEKVLARTDIDADTRKLCEILLARFKRIEETPA